MKMFYTQQLWILTTVLITAIDIFTLAGGYLSFVYLKENVSFSVFPQLNFWSLKILTHEGTLSTGPSRAAGAQTLDRFPLIVVLPSGDSWTDRSNSCHNPAVRIYGISHRTPARLGSRLLGESSEQRAQSSPRPQAHSLVSRVVFKTFIERILSNSQFYSATTRWKQLDSNLGQDCYSIHYNF